MTSTNIEIRCRFDDEHDTIPSLVGGDDHLPA